MKSRPLLLLALPVVLGLGIALPARGEPIPRVSARLEPEEVVVGRIAVLTVSAAWEGEASDLVFSRPVPPACRGLTPAGSSQRGIAYREGTQLRQVREFIFTLRGDREGTGRVGPVSLTYRRPPGEEEYTVSTEPLEASVVARPAGRGPASLPFPAVIALALAAAVLSALYIRWMVRRYQKKSNELIADYVENLESESRRELEGVRKHRLEGEPEKYCAGLRTVLIHYREQKNAAANPPGGVGETESPGIPPEEEAELTRTIDRLEELRFGASRDLLEELDGIYRRAEILLKRLEDLAAGPPAEN